MSRRAYIPTPPPLPFLLDENPKREEKTANSKEKEEEESWVEKKIPEGKREKKRKKRSKAEGSKTAVTRTCTDVWIYDMLCYVM
jgi:hypothetical protein